MSVPRLALDRPFTYLMGEGQGGGTGSLLSIPFHGRTVKGWVLGPAREVPRARLAPVRRVRGPVRFFDEPMLRLLRWTSERYIAPLATVIERSHPPRVASEENAEGLGPPADTPDTAPTYRATGTGQGPDSPILGPGVITWMRPLPGEEAIACVRAVESCVAAGKSAIVLVPEADPLPATARAVLERFGGAATAMLGGEARERYRTWLSIQAGRFAVVVGTRPAVFAPLERLGLVWVSREVHPGHREERWPYYHVREVAMARARLGGAACVLAALSPSVETATAVARSSIRALRPPRTQERAAAPLVEIAAPEAEERSARLLRLLKSVRSAALIVSRRGYGVARICRSCLEPAACAQCRGPLTVRGGVPACTVCGARGECSRCGGQSFGLERGGAERVAEWASRATGLRVDTDGAGWGEVRDSVLVGTAADVKDLGPLRLDLVAILDPDRALARPGLRSGEQLLATWMEAGAWARARVEGGKLLLQTRRPGHPAIQALVRWDPLAFLLEEARRRAEAGFAANHPVFRILGDQGLEAGLRSAGFEPLLSTRRDSMSVCLLAVEPEAVPALRREVLALAAAGTVSRVEAEPHF